MIFRPLFVLVDVEAIKEREREELWQRIRWQFRLRGLVPEPRVQATHINWYARLIGLEV